MNREDARILMAAVTILAGIMIYFAVEAAMALSNGGHLVLEGFVDQSRWVQIFVLTMSAVLVSFCLVAYWRLTVDWLFR